MGWQRAVLAVGWMLAFWLVTGPAAAETIKNTTPPFSITLPANYTSIASPTEKGAGGASTLMSYRQGGITQRDLGFLIQVDRLNGLLGRERPTDAELATIADKGITLETEPLKWHGADVWVARGAQSIQDRSLVVFVAQMPLKPEAIQVKVAVEAKDEREGRALLAQLVDSVEGETNWNDPASSSWGKKRIQMLGEGCGRLGISGTILGVVVVAIVRWIRRMFGGSSGAAETTIYAQPSMQPQAASAGTRTKCVSCGLISFASQPGTPCKRCGTPG